ncbi:hypothetical protein FRC01_010124, partial [Tulasnella sp. 417]
MPLLWNRLEFTKDVPRWDMLEAKLKRSGQAPLEIVVEEKVFLKSSMPHLRRIMRMIVPHIWRWGSLRMVDVPHKIRRVLLDQLRGRSAPLLRWVEVVQEPKYDRTWGRRIKSTSRNWDARSIFDGAPNLRHLEWTSPEADCRLLPPFQNLLTLKFGPGTLDLKSEQFIQLVFHILSVAPALQVLSLFHGPDSDDDTSDGDVEHLVQPPVTHSSLQLLHIKGRTSVRGVILRSLNLPKLGSLGEPLSDAEINTLCLKPLALSSSAPRFRGLVITGSADRAYSNDPTLNSYMPSLRSAITSFQGLVVVAFSYLDFGEFASDVPQWNLLEIKLERSSHASLDIVIAEKVFLKSGMPHLRRIMRMIVPHLERWKSLRMVDVPHKIRRVLLDQLRGKSAPLLQRVEVAQGKKYDRTWGFRIKSTSRHWDARKIFDGAPNLRHLEWTNPEAEYRLLPPFRNLLTLKMGPGTLDIQAEQFIQLVFRILSAAPDLQELSLSHGPDSDDIGTDSVGHLVQPPVTHSSLQLLHISGRTSVRGVILLSLNLPSLRSLGGPLPDAEINTLCCKAVARSTFAPSLRGIVITGSADRAYGSDPTLNSHTPSLPSAIMNFQNLVVLAFRFIDFGGNNKWLPNLGNCCLHLKSLNFLNCTGYTLKAIQAIVEMRMKREEVESLEELRIYPRYGWWEDTPSNEEFAWFEGVLRFNSIGA